MSVTITTTPGLFTSADRFRQGDPDSENELEAAALRYAARRLRRTGERLGNILDAILLLEQLADDPCEEHSGIHPVCDTHERR